MVLIAGFSLFAISGARATDGSDVSRKFTDSAYCERGTVIRFNSQKGNLIVNHWEKTLIRVEVTVIFENQDTQLAQREIEYARYYFQKSASEVFISNFFSLPPGIDRISSRIHVDYQVYVPMDVSLIINNEYGSCSVNNTTGYLNLNNKYGTILLKNVRGNTRIFSNLCDVRLEGISGKFDLNSTNSDIELRNINGDASLTTRNGTVIIEQGESLDRLEITSTFSELDVLVSDIYRYSYSISARKARIELGERYRRFPFDEKKEDKLVYQGKETDRLIDISANYNSVKLH